MPLCLPSAVANEKLALDVAAHPLARIKKHGPVSLILRKLLEIMSRSLLMQPRGFILSKMAMFVERANDALTRVMLLGINAFSKARETGIKGNTGKKLSLSQSFWKDAASVGLAILTLLLVPILFFGMIPGDDLMGFLQYANIAWASLMHMTGVPVIFITLIFGVVKKPEQNGCMRTCLALSLGLSACAIVSSMLQLAWPSWSYHPLLWGRYQVYDPQEIPSALEGLCLDKPHLCLNERQWNILSSGKLSLQNPHDVRHVWKGVQYAQQESGGFIVNVLSRDTVDAVGPLRQNVEGFLPFFKDKLAVVIFENDSKDGTRDAFKKWANEAQGYKVDLISCGHDNPDCQLGLSHRYDALEAKNYFTSSAIGKMADFRQEIVDHVINDPSYDAHSHMMVIDLDLKVSLSILGVLHTLGSKSDSVVASSGRQVWPGSFGSIVPLYDFTAFRVLETEANARLRNLHEILCTLMPPGDRWRNACDSVSSPLLSMILMHDWFEKEEPYAVASAYNGATIYPMRIIRDNNGGKYDAGDDGQRCEHVGFNLSLQSPVFVNPKWTLHLRPTNPGGPTGIRALKSLLRIALEPRLTLSLVVVNISTIGIFVYCWLVILSSPFFLPRLISLVPHRRRKGMFKLDGEDQSVPLASSVVSVASPRMKQFLPRWSNEKKL